MLNSQRIFCIGNHYQSNFEGRSYCYQRIARPEYRVQDLDFISRSLNDETRPRLFFFWVSMSRRDQDCFGVSISRRDRDFYIDLIIEFLCKKFPLPNPFFPLKKKCYIVLWKYFVKADGIINSYAKFTSIHTYQPTTRTTQKVPGD